MIDIAVIRLPRISNFTDFNPLESIPGVSLRYVKHVSELKSPDLIILPGTKNTMDDLKWLRECGLEAMIKKEAAKGTLIFGICGGYQMLGDTLKDPNGVEAGGSMAGLGLLPMDTIFAADKTRTQVEGHVCSLPGVWEPFGGTCFTGYEIHMGETTVKGQAESAMKIHDVVSGMDKTDGICRENVFGTYVHGIFDMEESALALMKVIGKKKGIDVSQLSGVDFAAFKESQYDILASELRKHLDMDAIYRIMKEGI